MACRSLGIQHWRETVRCQCGLVQFSTELRQCRRCKVSFDAPAEPVVLSVTPVPQVAAQKQRAPRKRDEDRLRGPSREQLAAIGVTAAAVAPIDVAAAVRFCREALGWSQRDLAKAMGGCPRTYVSKIERARAGECSLGRFLRLAAAFGLHPMVFFALCEVPGL